MVVRFRQSPHSEVPKRGYNGAAQGLANGSVLPCREGNRCNCLPCIPHIDKSLWDRKAFIRIDSVNSSTQKSNRCIFELDSAAHPPPPTRTPEVKTIQRETEDWVCMCRDTVPNIAYGPRCDSVLLFPSKSRRFSPASESSTTSRRDLSTTGSTTRSSRGGESRSTSIAEAFGGSRGAAIPEHGDGLGDVDCEN